MIKEIEKADIAECVAVIRESFMTVAKEFGFTVENAPRFTAFATTEERLRYQMENENRLMYAYYDDDDKIIGYYSLVMQDNSECELNNLCVVPAQRHRGLGGELLKNAYARAKEFGCKKLNIGIVEENKVLKSWYEKYGFVPVGTKKFDFFPFTCGYMEKKIGMTQRERMEAGLVYDPRNAELMKEQQLRLEKLYEFNATRPSEGEKRQRLLKEMLGSMGEGCYIEPPFRANWGGKNVHFGDHVYSNFNLTCVDDAPIYVGNDVMFAPNVTIATANHPISPELRKNMLQYNREVRIRNCVWIGSGTVIVPGVTIGENTVIGAGSVVTRDIPANVVAVGNPCRVLREIGEHDREYFYKNERIDWENLK